MKIYGLIGYPLSHSFSQKYFTEKFLKLGIKDSEYRNFSIDNISKFQEIINTTNELCGLNVTIPYKEQVMHYLNEIDDEAKSVGAVNTIKIFRKNGEIKLKGFNTDIFGFYNSLLPLLETKHKKALILGTGGASKAIKYILNKQRIKFISASIEELKENEIPYSDITKEIISENLLIINATPLGTFPNINTFPQIPYEYITKDHILFDLVYNPEQTAFLKFGLDKGAKIKNGLEMLYLQAEKAYEIWNA